MHTPHKLWKGLFSTYYMIIAQGEGDTRNYQPEDLVFHEAQPNGIPDPRVGNFWYHPIRCAIITLLSRKSFRKTH